ncbi:carbohydrate ABC transporter permease [Inquilinus sp. NPDC058860]|uniref:carbohydrate ABC transporter permease n=1 Tax=Inquilinus sp. NPDC058860 TaxID=3346652 RepID=UPI0036C31C87
MTPLSAMRGRLLGLPVWLWRGVLLHAGALFIVAWSAGPFLWQLSTSLQEDKALVAETPSWLPIPATLAHFVNIFTVKQFQLYLLNSVIVAGATTLFCLVLGALAAFALARLDIKGRFGILGLILSISMFPQIAIVAPLYLLAASMDLLDTYTVLVVVYVALGLPLVIWVLFGYFHSIPREIDDAARMDGAGPLTILFRVTLPMSLPGVVTTGLLGFIAAWNEFMFALAFTSDIGTQTVPVGIANFTNLYYVPWGDIAAASVVVTVPLVLLVLTFQRHIIAGLTQGAVKE